MVHEYCILDKKAYKHTLKICNIYYFYTETIFALTHLNVTFYVRCLYC